MTFTIDGVEYTKAQVWDWLKAERKWQDKVRQWLRAEGVSKHVLAERRRGRPYPPPVINRASRRALRRRLKLL
ncbi:hypothetical protein KIV63_gp41 [Mycobacterium phage SWU2]|uniref:Uncharacterized protein n=1 Tax=Mycobacterium phage SWU2 TaxID=2077150 RepID=A0A2K9VI35_9CAUD|nr:hypothetical protein KIV63_gp41 [Mycobacterium phage SWU2]AUV62003.1 hypothetical protein JX_gp44 [Mycobacterium phage SWU2]